MMVTLSMDFSSKEWRIVPWAVCSMHVLLF